MPRHRVSTTGSFPAASERVYDALIAETAGSRAPHASLVHPEPGRVMQVMDGRTGSTRTIIVEPAGASTSRVQLVDESTVATGWAGRLEAAIADRRVAHRHRRLLHRIALTLGCPAAEHAVRDAQRPSSAADHRRSWSLGAGVGQR